NKNYLIGFIVIILLGGCGIMEKDIASMDSKDLPDVPAFQDEFTREFMSSIDKVSDGYYLFHSKTGGYTLPFPEDAHIDQIHYEKVKDHYEGIKFGSDKEKITGESYTVYVTYENQTKPVTTDIQLVLASDPVHYEGEFEEKVHDELTHFFARQKYVVSDKESSTYFFFGVVQSNNSNQYITYRYAVECPDEQKGCDYDLDEIEQEVEKIMTSVEFTNEGEGD